MTISEIDLDVAPGDEIGAVHLDAVTRVPGARERAQAIVAGVNSTGVHIYRPGVSVGAAQRYDHPVVVTAAVVVMAAIAAIAGGSLLGSHMDLDGENTTMAVLCALVLLCVFTRMTLEFRGENRRVPLTHCETIAAYTAYQQLRPLVEHAARAGNVFAAQAREAVRALEAETHAVMYALEHSVASEHQQAQDLGVLSEPRARTDARLRRTTEHQVALAGKLLNLTEVMVAVSWIVRDGDVTAPEPSPTIDLFEAGAPADARLRQLLDAACAR